MKVYLCARYGRRAELLDYRADLIAAGHDSTARWLEGDDLTLLDAALTTTASDQGAGFALNDLEDLRASEILVFFSEPPDQPGASRGGRHVEFGFALAGGMLAIVVGERENAFHCLPRVEVVADWPHALRRINASWGARAR